MMKVLTSVCITLSVLITCNGFGVEKEEPKDNKPIFLKEVPLELTVKISQELGELSRKYPLSEKKAKEVENIVRGFKLQPTAAADDKQKHRLEQADRIRRFDVAAIPAIARMMLSRDDELRLNAFDALSFLMMKRYECKRKATDDDRATDSLLILLFNRALYDRNADVRLYAIGGLSGIGFVRSPDIPEGVKTSLQKAEREDPLLMNRRAAHADRVKLGLTEWDPELLPGGVLVE